MPETTGFELKFEHCSTVTGDVCCVQTVVLINGQEIKDYSFASGIFRTTYVLHRPHDQSLML